MPRSTMIACLLLAAAPAPALSAAPTPPALGSAMEGYDHPYPVRFMPVEAGHEDALERPALSQRDFRLAQQRRLPVVQPANLGDRGLHVALARVTQRVPAVQLVVEHRDGMKGVVPDGKGEDGQ